MSRELRAKVRVAELVDRVRLYVLHLSISGVCQKSATACRLCLPFQTAMLSDGPPPAFANYRLTRGAKITWLWSLACCIAGLRKFVMCVASLRCSSNFVVLDIRDRDDRIAANPPSTSQFDRLVIDIRPGEVGHQWPYCFKSCLPLRIAQAEVASIMQFSDPRDGKLPVLV